MKKIMFIVMVFASLNAKSQANSIDSLGKIIKTMQSQIAALQKQDTLVFTTGQMTLTTISPTTKKVSIDNYASFLTGSNAVLTTQLTAATARITALEASLKALQTKVTGLKAVSTTTTIIQ